jgi:hypothetical protein
MFRTLIITTVAIVCLQTGCSSNDGLPDVAQMVDSGTGVGPAGSLEQEHDFGTVLALGQTLRHQFTIKNPSEMPIRLLHATVFTPCCSAIGAHPTTIGPNGQAEILVALKAGRKFDNKAVAFSIETDDKLRPAYRLRLTATFVPDWEVVKDDGPKPTVRVNQPGTRKLRIIARSKGNEGRRLPDSVGSSGRLRASFSSPATEKPVKGRLVEAAREVEVELPITSAPGSESEDVVFRWNGGATEVTRVRWDVLPYLRITPASLFVRPSGEPVQRDVRIDSAGERFRVISVDSHLLARPVAFSDGAASQHRLTLSLNVGRAGAESNLSSVTISTDHPGQKVAVLSVIVLKGTEGVQQ